MTADRVLPHLDAVGASASFLCAAHCAAMPMLLNTVPLAGLDVLASHGFEQGFVVAAALFALVVIGSGYCVHRLRQVVVAFLVAVALLFTGAFVVEDGVPHAALLTAGGVLLGVAHALNRRGVRHHRCARNAWGGVWRGGARAPH